MGNSASTERAEFAQRDERRFSQLVQERNRRSVLDIRGNLPDQIDDRITNLGFRPTDGSDRRDSNAYGTFRRQVSAHSVIMQTEGGQQSQTVGADQVVYEQEERPLVNMEELGLRNAPITHIAATASPLNRRRSTLSRIGSRILPDVIVRGFHNGAEEPHVEDQTPRNPIAARFSRPAPGRRQREQENGNRLSMFGSLGGRHPSVISRRQSIRGPFLTDYTNAEHLHDIPAETTYLNPAYPSNNTEASLDPSRSYSWQRRARLSRVRNSLTAPLSSIFGQPLEVPSQPPRTPPRRPSRVAFAEDSDQLLPTLTHMADPRLDFDEPAELDSVEPELRHPLLSSPTASTRALNAANGIRRLPHALRSRSTRLIRRGEPTSLSTILHVAASAIAAQLSGSPTPPVPAGAGLGGEGLDSLHTLLQTLQNATTLPTNGDGTGNAAGEPPVNILRVFRFVNGENRGGASSAASTASAGGPDSTMEPTDTEESPRDNLHDGRTVTLVVVGVRSVPSDGSPEDEIMGPSLDTLLSLPLIPSTTTRANGPRDVLRRADVRSRWSSRRNSMGSFSSFPSQYDSQRHHRSNNSVRSQSELTPLNASALPTLLSESPPGPHPPPSTPAEPGLSGTTTPSRRPSSASAIHPPTLPHLSEHPTPRSDHNNDDRAAETNPVTQRRRSDSEFARRPELGSGAARRNGVVEPDSPPAQGGRSWLIYVVGTNVSENHPAFATPSLFTDNPTYEDMLLISSLLGPAKPPVASEAEVTSAGGIYRIVESGGSLIAESLGGAEPIALTSEDRCLICLSDYDLDEELRLLNKCKHMYHRECIDEVMSPLLYLLTSSN